MAEKSMMQISTQFSIIKKYLQPMQHASIISLITRIAHTKYANKVMPLRYQQSIKPCLYLAALHTSSKIDWSLLFVERKKFLWHLKSYDHPFPPMLELVMSE